MEYLGLAQAYHLFDKPTNNSEIFSLMRDSDYPASEYLDNFFDTGFERAQNTD